jgi:ERCC4-type nuclease
MMLIDDRIGSKDLIGPLIRSGVPAELTRLVFADCAFVGRGVQDEPVTIGIELKETRDLLSSLHSGRFQGHQLPGLLSTYDRVWLLTEGIWRAGPGGALETLQGSWRQQKTGRRAVLVNDVESWLLSQIIRGGIHHWHSSTRCDSVRFLSVLYHWWCSKSLDQHRGHQTIYYAPPDRATFIEPSLFQRIAGCLPGVGWDRSIALDQHFQGSLRGLLSATAEDLLAVDGIGPKTAQAIVTSLQ